MKNTKNPPEIHPGSEYRYIPCLRLVVGMHNIRFRAKWESLSGEPVWLVDPQQVPSSFQESVRGSYIAIAVCDDYPDDQRLMLALALDLAGAEWVRFFDVQHQELRLAA